MINSQTRDRRGGHKTTPLASQRGTVGFTPEERDFIKRNKREGRSQARKEPAQAVEEYQKDRLGTDSWGDYRDHVQSHYADVEWQDWEHFADSLFGN